MLGRLESSLKKDSARLKSFAQNALTRDLIYICLPNGSRWAISSSLVHQGSTLQRFVYVDHVWV